MDVLVSAVALLVFLRFENSRTRIPERWLSLITVLTVGVSLRLAVFLYLRERALEHNPPDSFAGSARYLLWLRGKSPQEGVEMSTAPTAGRTETLNLNGIRIYSETHGSGEALLLLHGFSGSSQDWLPSALGWGPDWLPSALGWGPDFQIILPDLRGHGRSGILPKPFRHQDAAADKSRCSTTYGLVIRKGFLRHF